MGKPSPVSAAEILVANVRAGQAVLVEVVALAPAVQRAAEAIATSLQRGGKLLCCGNGGSAADSAHFTAEIAARFVLDRPGYPAIDLTANHSLVTALLNDFPPEEVFARQVQAFGVPGDVLAVFSTSGRSGNVQQALRAARERGLATIAFLGRDGGACRGLADVELVVPSLVTARIQEAHLLLYHSICEAIDPVLARR